MTSKPFAQSEPRDDISPPPGKKIMWKVTPKNDDNKFVMVSAKTADDAKEIATRLMHLSIQELTARISE